jgi:hypothetical protein
MNEYPKKEEYNAVKRLSKKDRKTIGTLEEFLDFRFKYDPPSHLKYGDFFIPFFNYYNIIDLTNRSFEYGYLYFSVFISNHRKEVLELKEALNIKDFYLYRYQDNYGACCDDLAGVLFNNKQEKMIFLLKHADIIDTMN